MAESNSILNIIVRLKDETQKSIGGIQKSLKDLQPAFRTMAAVGVGGFAAITGAVALSIREFQEAEAAQQRLEHILKTSRGATDDQVAALHRQAAALQRVGVVADDTITIAQGQLATFDLQAKSIEKLIPSILDYVVAEKGIAASTEDVKQLTNGLAQALMGNFGSLTRTGFVLDQATRDMISMGSETERVTALVKVLNSTYEGMNEAARKTSQGGMQALINQVSDLKELIGVQFAPILQDIVKKISPVVEAMMQWVEVHPELTRNLIIAAAAVTAFVGALGILGITIFALTPALNLIIGLLPMIGGLFLFITSPIGLVTIAIGALVAAILFLSKNWRDVTANMVVVFDALKANVGLAIDWMRDKFQGFSDWISGIVNTIVSAVRRAIDAVTGLPGVSQVLGSAKSAVGTVRGILGFAQGGIVPGPVGAPRLAVVHGGEAVVPPGRGLGGVVINVYGDVTGEELIERVKDSLMAQLRLDTRFSL